MRDPEQFDAFYKGAHDRLLVQTFCLTGDLAVARRAARDAFVVAWHHWRKLSTLEDPESAVRPHAWRLAQRRSAGRPWHREKNMPDDVRATVEALGRLTTVQRKAVLLTQLAAVSMAGMAREIGVTPEVAERELQLGVTQLSLVREVPASALPVLLEPVAQWVVPQMRWPRPTIIRRAGAARRRTHTVVGVVAAGACVIVSGLLVTDTTGIRPTLRPADRPVGGSMIERPDMPELDADLITAGALERRLGGDWNAVETDTDPSDNVPLMACQRRASADRRGTASLVRTFEKAGQKKPDKKGKKDKKPAPASALQLTDLSRTPDAARRTFERTVEWFAGCRDARVQLLTTRAPDGVGDEAVQLALRSWADPERTFSVAVARSGLFTTAVYLDTPGTEVPGARDVAAILREAVSRLCGQDDAGACPSGPEDRRPDAPTRDPVPTGKVAALLAAVDLPPLRKVDAGWVAPPAGPPEERPVITPCAPETFLDRFQKTDFSHAATRSFVIPGAGLPDEFGLTETVAALPRSKAAAFIEVARGRMADCADKQLGTTVERLVQHDDGDASLSVWRLTIRVDDKTTLRYVVGMVRRGTAVAQLEFVPAGEVIAHGDVVDIARRAQERLGALPTPS